MFCLRLEVRTDLMISFCSLWGSSGLSSNFENIQSYNYITKQILDGQMQVIDEQIQGMRFVGGNRMASIIIRISTKIRQYNYMEAYSTTTALKRFHPDCPEELNDDEGFAQEEAESLIVPKHEHHDDLGMPKSARKKPSVLYRQPKLKLTFITQERNMKDQLRKSILNKEERSYQARSLEVSKRDSRKSIQMNFLSECVAKIKRAVVGQNISIPTFSLADSKAIKTHILSSGAPLIYEQPKQINTHGFIRNMGQQASTFLESEANQLLKMKLRDSFIMPKKLNKKIQGKDIEFEGDYQNANLEFVSQIGEKEFELYLRNDTNTHGHQSWFLFRVNNLSYQSQRITLHICNLKRYLCMYNEGARVYLRKSDQTGKATQWEQGGENVQFKINNNNRFTNVRVFKLSFDIAIEKMCSIEVALLPPFTYSEILDDISQLQTCQHLKVETLTYSLVGMAVPLLTFTRGESPHKQVILVNARVHPGESNASFMCRGLIRWLSQDTIQVRDFLEKHIVKIIPILNPDGVVFGNFRTNFLGADLNRSFDSEDEVTNPQVSALKDLGLKLKEEYGERFNLFLDLHGHSSEKNIFTYGPEYDTTDSNFYQIRLLPKILNLKSKMFKYHSCTFKLEDYKRYTARGFFLNTVGTLAYTIEASYAFFQDEGKLCPLGPAQWEEFGQTIAQSLSIFGKISKLSLLRNKLDIKKAIGEADKEQIQLIKRFKKEFKKEKEEPLEKKEKKRQKGTQDSDGEGDTEDYTRAEKEQVIRRVAETVAPNMILPRVLKPSIVYPTVTPKLFKYREDFEQSHFKILYTRRGSKYNGLRMQGNIFVQSLKGMELPRPDAKQLFF